MSKINYIINTLPPGEIESTQQSSRNRVPRQSSAHKELGTHLIRCKSHSFSSNTSVASNSDSVSTSPSIIGRTDTPVSGIGCGANSPPKPSASNIAARVKACQVTDSSASDLHADCNSDASLSSLLLCTLFRRSPIRTRSMTSASSQSSSPLHERSFSY